MCLRTPKGLLLTEKNKKPKIKKKIKNNNNNNEKIHVGEEGTREDKKLGLKNPLNCVFVVYFTMD